MKKLHAKLRYNFTVYNVLINVTRLLYLRLIHPTVKLIHYHNIVLGKSVTVRDHTMIHPGGSGSIQIMNDCWLADNVVLEANKIIKLGCNTSIQSRTRIIGDVTIGDGCLFGPNVFVSSGTHLFDKEEGLTIREQEKKFKAEHKPINIGNDCWIGANVVIMPGVVLSDGCVVGANSVVTKSMPEYSVVGGVPAKVIKRRYE